MRVKEFFNNADLTKTAIFDKIIEHWTRQGLKKEIMETIKDIVVSKLLLNTGLLPH